MQIWVIRVDPFNSGLGQSNPHAHLYLLKFRYVCDCALLTYLLLSEPIELYYVCSPYIPYHRTLEEIELVSDI